MVNRSRIAGYDATLEIQIALPGYDVCVDLRSATLSKCRSYDQNTVNPSAPAARVRRVRSERGNPATNYDPSPAIPPKPRRSQIGRKYDAKKVRNS